MSNLPRILIAAPKSGSGKTIFTCGLLNLLAKEGGASFDAKGVAAFKCGPDYIDPMFHRKVIGVESENLDSFFSTRDEIKGILSRAQGKATVLEGVMGIYDGIGGTSGKGSCYEVASITETPVLLVLNGSGIGNTLIALAEGILKNDTNGLIKGIVINQTSETYYKALLPGFKDMLSKGFYSAEMLGFIPKDKNLSLESRHLGLKLPEEIHDLKKQLDGFSRLIMDHCDVDEIKKIMIGAPDVNIPESLEEKEGGASDLRIAVARDEAFCFYYEENMRALREAGIETVEFSPLHDDKLPENVQGLLLGGGYPELYLEVLEKNSSMRNSIKEAIQSGMPSLAECGGFMYLMDAIRDHKDVPHQMVGVISGESQNTGRLSRFGYINIEAKRDGIIPKGSTIKGHEFHYFDSNNNGEDLTATKASGTATWNCLHMGSNYLWGYPHLYYRSCPSLVRGLKEAMMEYIKK